jgi:transketolase
MVGRRPRSSGSDETMRLRMCEVVNDIAAQDARLFGLFSDISCNDYFEPAMRAYPERMINLGIMEQAALSAAAGVALEGFIPLVHSIAPFIVERPFEQIKVDFIYQRLGVNITSIGASYDYASDGYSHHAPGDVAILKSLPGMEVVVPGTPAEFEVLFRAAYDNGSPTYFRLSSRRNRVDHDVSFGALTVVRRAGPTLVVAVGPMLQPTLEATGDLPVSVLYCTTVAPFDGATLHALAGDEPTVILVEPYYAGALVGDLAEALSPRRVRVEAIGVPHEVIVRYGDADDHDADYGLTTTGLRKRIRAVVTAERAG